MPIFEVPVGKLTFFFDNKFYFLEGNLRWDFEANFDFGEKLLNLEVDKRLLKFNGVFNDLFEIDMIGVSGSVGEYLRCS